MTGEGAPPSVASPELDEDHLRQAATSGLERFRHIGLAVSGGGDSVAMLWLVAPWAKARGVAVSVATVDHGLRPEAAEEARFVEGLCRDIGVPHHTLRWAGWDGRGNLQARARDARRTLLTEWARGRGVDAILLAHTRDDQAETFLLRLARGSGVDGLSGMVQERVDDDGLRWLRPLLGESRAALRDYLGRVGRRWIDDPSNSDLRHDRVKARQALSALEPLGLRAEDLARTAWRLSLASDALRHHAAEAAGRIAVATRAGEVSFEFDAFVQLPYETHLRLAAEAIRWISGGTYRPRLLSLQESLALSFSRPRTLSGTLLRRRSKLSAGARLVIGREPRGAARVAAVPTTALWDGRWRLSGPHAPDLEVRMLGDAGLALCPDWWDTGLDRTSLLASPAVWRGTALVAAPVAGRPEGWAAQVVPGFHQFLASGR